MNFNGLGQSDKDKLAACMAAVTTAKTDHGEGSRQLEIAVEKLQRCIKEMSGKVEG
jgi:hypothetical protein